LCLFFTSNCAVFVDGGTKVFLPSGAGTHATPLIIPLQGFATPYYAIMALLQHRQIELIEDREEIDKP